MINDVNLYDSKGFLKVYKQLFKIGMPGETVLIFSWLVDIYDFNQYLLVKNIDGVEYKRFSTNFINENLNLNYNRQKMKEIFDSLEKAGYLTVKNISWDGEENKNGERFVHLNSKVLEMKE